MIEHWLTENFEYKEHVLKFTEIEGPHTGKNMAEIVVNLLEKLAISMRLITITDDNAGNNDTLANEILHDLQKIYSSALGSTEII